jgi:uncharacterized FlgJ-related protein
MKNIRFGLFAAIVVAGLFQFCAGSKSKPAATTATKQATTFEANVLPLLKTKCTPCHMAPDGKKKHYVTYDVVKTDIDDMIRRVSLSPTDKGFMPFKKTEKLPDSLIAVFVKWKADGLLEK